MPDGRLTRRGFVQAVSVGMALGSSWAERLAGSRADEPDEKPLFRFVQWNDVHVDETQPPGYRLANEKMQYLVRLGQRRGPATSL